MISTMKSMIRAIQKAVGVEADGVVGPVTLKAIAEKLGVEAVPERVWPRQVEVRKGTSVFGRAGDESNLVNIKPPYPVYYEGREVKTLRVHKLIADAVLEAMGEILRVYGPTRIRELRLDQYGGSYNYRKTSSGGGLSMHAWGIALDWCPDTNTYGMTHRSASLARPECEAFWEAWERVGAVSLGREQDYDWMHVQFARLS